MRNLKLFNLPTFRLELLKLKQMVLFLFLCFIYIAYSVDLYLHYYITITRCGYILEVQILTLDYPGDIDM